MTVIMVAERQSSRLLVRVAVSDAVLTHLQSDLATAAVFGRCAVHWESNSEMGIELVMLCWLQSILESQTLFFFFKHLLW